MIRVQAKVLRGMHTVREAELFCFLVSRIEIERTRIETVTLEGINWHGYRC